MPDPNVRRVLVVETDIPLTEKHKGYDPEQFASFVDMVREAMEEVEAEKAEIYPIDGGGPILHGGVRAADSGPDANGLYLAQDLISLKGNWTMKAGVVYPQVELGGDTGRSRRLPRRPKTWVTTIS